MAVGRPVFQDTLPGRSGRQRRQGPCEWQSDQTSRILECGDQLAISRGEERFQIRVLGLSSFRRPAVEARLLYEESEGSIRAREEAAQLRRDLTVFAGRVPTGKPDKRERRRIRHFVCKD